MKLAPLILVGIMTLVNISSAQTLDFSNIESSPLSWKGVFDGGFHPAWRGNGESVCHQSEVRPILKNGERQFQLTKGAIQFTVIGDYKMSSVSYYGREGLTEQEANQRIDQFIALFPNANRVTKGHVKKVGGRYNYRDEGSNTTVYLTNGAVNYSFGASGDRDKEIAERLTYGLHSKLFRGVGRRVGGKIQPPEGYEHLSLEPLVVNKAYYDDLARRAREFNHPKAKAAREKKQQEIERIRNEMNQNQGQLSQSRGPEEPPQPTSKEKKRIPVSWCIVGFVVLLAVVLLILRNK